MDKNLQDELMEQLRNGTAQIFDVREQDEWDEGHLSDAKLVPLSELHAGLEPENADPSKKTYLYCRSGNRVHMAAPLLQQMGFNAVIPLNEGFEELRSNGFTVE